MENGEWRSRRGRERGKPTETTCARRQLPKNKNSTTHSARKAHHPALRLPAVSLDIPLVDAGLGEGRITCQNSSALRPSPGHHPPYAHQPANFFASLWDGKLIFHLFGASVQSRKLYSAPQIIAGDKKQAMTCQCLHLDAGLGGQALLRHCHSHAGNGPHRNRCLISNPLPRQLVSFVSGA